MLEPSNPLSALLVRIQVWLGLYECAPGPQLKSEGYYLHEMVSPSLAIPYVFPSPYHTSFLHCPTRLGLPDIQLTPILFAIGTDKV